MPQAIEVHPSNWPTFVAHRCSKIHSYLHEAYWNHVSTRDNPADCVSRGKLPDEESFSLWWEGGSVIRAPMSPISGFQCKSVNVVSYNFNVNVNKNKKVHHWDLLNKYSDLQKLLRVTSYILRFLDRLLIKTKIKCKISIRKELKLFNNC